MAGFLPFSAIYIELHYIFASLWGHKIYTLFGILFLAFIMLIIAMSLCRDRKSGCISECDNVGNRFHYSFASLLSTGTWGLSVVVAFSYLRWVDERLHIRLLLLLFFSSVKHERYDPGEFLLWLHGYNLLCLLSYAGSCWVPCHICVYMSHLLCSKSRLTHPGHIKFHNQLSKCKTLNKK